MNEMKLSPEISGTVQKSLSETAQENVKSAVTNALEQPSVHEASKARLRTRIQEIQRAHPDLIFPMREEELEGFVRAFQHNCINGSCLPEDVDAMILDNLSLLKRAHERRRSKARAA